MNKQTAVEWLIEQLARKNNEFQALTFYYDHKEEIEQAKEMEKWQIIDAHCEGQFDKTEAYPPDKAEECYNKTYNK
jgi:hypothetical protein